MLPLEGITVVALEQAVAGPLATSRMVDAGARVIKIEREGGDFARRYDTSVGGDSSYFAWVNHGKESVVLDIKARDDAALLDRMIAGCDVFLQNLSPGSLDRAGFGSETLRTRHPQLITCDITGYGDTPQMADKKAYDLLVQAESGLVAVSGGPGELGRIGVSLCDIGTGITAYTAILEALVSRVGRGFGAGVSVSLFDVAAEWMTVPFAQHLYGDGGPERVGLRHPTIAPYGAFETSDGSLTLIAVQNEREWQRLSAGVLERPSLGEDVRFASNHDRVKNRAALEQELSTVIATLTGEQFRQRLTAGSIAFATVSSLHDLAEHVALRRRKITSSHGTEVDLPAHPARGLLDNSENRGVVPRPGQHSAAIRKEFSL